MKQQLITPFFKRVKTESNETALIKEEIDIDWDEQNNTHEIKCDNVKEDNHLIKCPEIALKRPSVSKNKKKLNVQELSALRKVSVSKTKKKVAVEESQDTKMESKFQCEHCPFKSKWKHSLRDHIMRKHMKPIVIGKIKSYKVGNHLFSHCPKCKKLIKTKSYVNHTFYCDRKRHLQCAHCSYKTKWKSNLIFHIHRKHPKGSNTPSTEIHTNGIKRYCENCDRAQEHHRSIKDCQTCFSTLLFQCSKCKKAFEKRQAANDHWKSRCGLSGYFHCYFCDYKSVRRCRVAVHLKTGHPDSKTNRVIRWKSLFDNADNQVSSLYQCLNCGKPMRNAQSLKMHMKVCRDAEKQEISIDVSSSDPTRCSNCHKKFEHVYLLNRHLTSCLRNQYAIRITKDSDDEFIEVVEDHAPVTLIPLDEIRKDIEKMAVRRCGKCGEESAFRENYNGVNQNKQCQKCKVTLGFKCKKCQKTFSSKSSIIWHLKSVCYPDEEYQCTKCEFKAVSLFRVQQHYKSVHDTVSADCNICGKKFKNIKCLKMHQTNCGAEPKFQCGHCRFKTKRKAYLTEHIFRKHMEAKVIDRVQSFKIACQRFSRTLTHLKAYCFKCKKDQSLHKRLKTCIKCKNKMYFKCKTCQKKYTADDEKACNHVKDYLELIKFECELCGRGAMTKASISMHRSRCGKSFPCRFCKYVSNVKGVTIKHEKTKH